jgi:energy-coupling factor transporter ATP-binding protein EcfA2
LSRLEVKALRFIDRGPFELTVDDGECVCLTGPSGMGKTLLLRSIADLDCHDGDVLLDGVEFQSIDGPIWRQQVGMLPIINAMAAAGIVSLPGMMTGQILGGNPPVEAVKYQILIMFLIAGGTGLGVMFALWLTARRLFDDRHRLRLDRIKGGESGQEARP